MKILCELKTINFQFLDFDFSLLWSLLILFPFRNMLVYFFQFSSGVYCLILHVCRAFKASISSAPKRNSSDCLIVFQHFFPRDSHSSRIIFSCFRLHNFFSVFKSDLKSSNFIIRFCSSISMLRGGGYVCYAALHGSEVSIMEWERDKLLARSHSSNFQFSMFTAAMKLMLLLLLVVEIAHLRRIETLKLFFFSSQSSTLFWLLWSFCCF